MRIYIMALEPIDTRYTGQWYYHLPLVFFKHIVNQKPYVDIDVITIDGYDDKTFPQGTTSATTEGAFLNFLDTNIWKNNQINKLVSEFKKKEVNAGDKILFPDAWHSGILQIKYISELLDIPVQIHSIWHAGSYDPQDFLGRKIKDKNWTFNAERSYFYASNYNYFATEYHVDLFIDNLEPTEGFDDKKIILSGLPFEFLWNELKPYKNLPKKNKILFPHRIAPEKQPEIFKDLAKEFPDYEFIFCQDKKLTKHEYHTLLGESKAIFSANLQETFGISAVEACIVGTIPILPKRLSYKEMYKDIFMYDSMWTESFENYLKYKQELVSFTKCLLDLDIESVLESQAKDLLQYFCTPEKLYKNLING